MEIGKVRRRVAALLAAPVVAAALGCPALAAPAATGGADGTGTRWLLDDLGGSVESSPGSPGGDLFAQVPVPVLPVPLNPRMALPGQGGVSTVDLRNFPGFSEQDRKAETRKGVVCEASVTEPAFVDLESHVGSDHEVRCTKDGQPFPVKWIKIEAGYRVNGFREPPYPARNNLVCVNQATCSLTTVAPQPMPIPVLGTKYQAYTRGWAQVPPIVSVGAASPVVEFWGRGRW